MKYATTLLAAITIAASALMGTGCGPGGQSAFLKECIANVVDKQSTKLPGGVGDAIKNDLRAICEHADSCLADADSQSAGEQCRTQAAREALALLRRQLPAIIAGAKP